jgi:hypothetical protein
MLGCKINVFLTPTLTTEWIWRITFSFNFSPHPGPHHGVDMEDHVLIQFFASPRPSPRSEREEHVPFPLYVYQTKNQYEDNSPFSMQWRRDGDEERLLLILLAPFSRTGLFHIIEGFKHVPFHLSN